MNRAPFSYFLLCAFWISLLTVILAQLGSQALASTGFDHDQNGNLVTVQSSSPTPPILVNSLLRDAMVVGDDAVRFTVFAKGSGPLIYEWRINGAIIPGATGDTLALPLPIEPADLITVTVSNSYGSVTSIPASLVVEIPDAITREVGVFIGAEPDPPYRMVETREVSLVIADPSAPPRIEDFAITPAPTGSTVTLNWSGYDQYAVRDVVRYDIYYATSAFANIAGMTPFASVGGENFTWTRSGFPDWQDLFFAVVPVDGQGNQITEVIYSAAYPLMSETLTREVGIFIGEEPDPPYRMVETREVSLVISDPSAPPRIEDFAITPSPTGSTVTLNWSGYDQYAVRDVVRYDIYYATGAFANIAGMTPFASVGGENFTWTRSGFPDWQDHFFAVVPVDGEGNRISDVVYSAAYPLMPETLTREVALFIGAEPDPPYRYVETREVGLVVADDTTPAAVTGSTKVFDANISGTFFGGVNLDWSDYDLWGQRDVVRYRIYYSDQFFSNINEPGVQLAGFSQDGRMATMISGAFEKKVYYFAVVAEDSSGNLNPAVYARSTKTPMPDFMEFALNGGRSLRNGVLPIDSAMTPLFIEYTYTRSQGAMQGGAQFRVEWSDNLSIWHTTGVSESVLQEDSLLQTVKAFIPRGETGRRFVRLRVIPPAPLP